MADTPAIDAGGEGEDRRSPHYWLGVLSELRSIDLEEIDRVYAVRKRIAKELSDLHGRVADPPMIRTIRMAIANPGYWVGGRLGPTWRPDSPWHAEEQETVSQWAARAVMVALSGARPLDDSHAPADDTR